MQSISHLKRFFTSKNAYCFYNIFKYIDYRVTQKLLLIRFSSSSSSLPNIGIGKKALSAVDMALKMKKAIKKRAQRLFNRALALLHPDVLNRFGEFPEEKNNIIKADHPFVRVLTLNPYRSCSLVNRKALSAVDRALKMKKANKKRAQRLFNRALALLHHPDVLNRFGEFPEEKNNIIKADHLFLRALTLNPYHSGALVNRKRTLPVVNEMDEKELKRINEKQMELMKLSHNNPALNRLKKESYFQYIYNTVAIEGNTMTLEDTRIFIETGLPVSGKSSSEHMEIVGVESALRYINKTLITKEIITIFDILEIHKLVLGYVKPRIAGSFRQCQVFVDEHTPPLAADVAYLMDEYVEWIQSYEFTHLHPVKQAALAHFKLTFIHPFVDGNGRTARLVMYMIQMRYGYPPVIIRNNERNDYFRILQLANEGDVRPFVRFIAHCTERTLNVYLLSGGDYNVKC